MSKLKATSLFYGLFKRIRQLFWTTIVKKTSQKHGKGLKVKARSKIGRNVILGENCYFNGINISNGGLVSIGNNFHSGSECRIIVTYHNYDRGESIPYDHTYINKSVVIADNVWIGTRVIILGNVHIGEGAVIQAGSVVVNDIPAYAIAGGNPAKCFKMRDIEHYEELKKLQKFY